MDDMSHDSRRGVPPRIDDIANDRFERNIHDSLTATLPDTASPNPACLPKSDH
jgi:hypothetical protein